MALIRKPQGDVTRRQFFTAGHTTIRNCYVTPLIAYGNPDDYYGKMDLKMSRKKLAQTGAIKQSLA